MLAQLVFQYSRALIPVTVLLIALTLLTLLTYGRMSKPISGYWRFALPALRLLAMSAIAVSILRPVITRPRVARERAPVVILLDNSQSMSVIDSGRPPAEWVGIAQALNTLPAESRDMEIDSLQSDCDRLSAQADEVSRASADFDYVKLSGRDVEGVQIRLDRSIKELQTIAHSALANASKLKRANPLEKTLAYLERIPVGIDRQIWLEHIRDKARAAAGDAEQARLQSDARLYRTNQDVRDACTQLQSLSRIQLAQKLIEEPTNGLIARLGPDTPVQLFTVSDRITPIQLSNVINIPADGTISNLTGGIRGVIDSMQMAPPRAIVLFSDGRQTHSDPDSVGVAGVPIYTVGIAARAGSKVINSPLSNSRPTTRQLFESELTDVTGDEPWLRHLAESTNGQFLRLDQLDQLPKELMDIPEDENHQIQIALWDSPYLLCLVLGCLTIEWALRKRFGLA